MRSDIVKDARPELVMLLLRAGVLVGHWQEPLEDHDLPGDDRPDPTLPPITAVELIAFRAQLDGLPTAGEQ